MTIVDTGVVLALLDELHPRHGDAKKAVRVGAISITPPTLTEATRIIRRHANDHGLDGNQVARKALSLLRSLPGYRLAPQPPEVEVAQFYTESPGLSYAGAWNLAASIHAAEPLVTFDNQLQRHSKNFSQT